MRSKGSKGRPATKPAILMNGFYIEVRNKGSRDRGIKIRLESKAAMDASAKMYSRNKDVIVLGECKNEKWLSSPVAYGNTKPVLA